MNKFVFDYFILIFILHLFLYYLMKWNQVYCSAIYWVFTETLEVENVLRLKYEQEYLTSD